MFGGIAIVAIAVTVAFNVTLSNQKQDAANMLALANVEALADGEDPNEEPPVLGQIEVPATVKCSDDGEPMAGGLKIYCKNVTYVSSCSPFDPCNY